MYDWSIGFFCQGIPLFRTATDQMDYTFFFLIQLNYHIKSHLYSQTIFYKRLTCLMPYLPHWLIHICSHTTEVLHILWLIFSRKQIQGITLFKDIYTPLADIFVSWYKSIYLQCSTYLFLVKFAFNILKHHLNQSVCWNNWTPMQWPTLLRFINILVQ